MTPRFTLPTRSTLFRLAGVLALATLTACSLDPLTSVSPGLSVDEPIRAPIESPPKCEQYAPDSLTDICWVSRGGGTSVLVDPITFVTMCTCTYGG